MVTENELKSLLRSHGWGFRWRKADNLRVAYAQRRVGKRVLTRYLVAETRLGEFTEADVLKRIQLQ